MAAEVWLFWAVLAGFLLADNLVLAPAGGDALRFGRNGRWRYGPGPRLQARGRDLLLLNPLNPFDRVALTTRALGPLRAAQWRQARRQLRLVQPVANVLSLLGSVYLAGLLLLLGLSAVLHFGIVLAALLALHLSVWGAALAVMVRRRACLSSLRPQWPTLAAEAFFVPAYTVNLGKRLWYRSAIDLPAFAVGLRQYSRMAPGPARELLGFELDERLTDLSAALADATHLKPWLEEVRACLKTSAPPAGS